MYSCGAANSRITPPDIRFYRFPRLVLLYDDGGRRCIIAGGIYYKHRTPCVLIAITLAAIILNTLGPLLWLKFVESVWDTTLS